MKNINTVLSEFISALDEMWLRCPACHGVRRVRQLGHTVSCYCLVCEDLAKARWSFDSVVVDVRYVRPDSSEVMRVVRDILIETKKFARHCPCCFGVRKVWSYNQRMPCLVCQKITEAISDVEQTLPLGLRREEEHQEETNPPIVVEEEAWTETETAPPNEVAPPPRDDEATSIEEELLLMDNP